MTTIGSKRVKGLPVLSIADGERLGKIERAFLDPGGTRLVAFVVDGSGRSSLAKQVSGLVSGESGGAEETGLLRVEDVHALGPDALTVDDRAKVRFGEGDPPEEGLLDLEELTTRKVVTENGTYVGQVASLSFDPGSFRLTEIEASPGFFKSNTPVAADQITSVGSDLFVVADAVCAPPEPPAGQRMTSGESRHVIWEDRRTGNAGSASS